MAEYSEKSTLRARPRLIGKAGTSVRDGFIEDVDQNTEVRNEKWYGEPGKIGIASKMMRDSHVRLSFGCIANPIIGALWDFKPADKSQLAFEIADFLRYNFFEKIYWSQTLRHALLYIRDGFSLLEETDDVAPISKERFPLHPGNGYGICLTGMHYRPSWTVRRWYQSKYNPAQLESVEQWITGSDVEDSGFIRIPADRLVRFTWEQEGANYAGFAPLRSAYGPWKVKLLLLIVEAIRHEREHTGVPTLNLPEGATNDLIEEAQQILAELRAHEKGYLILPNGYEFKFSTTETTTDIGSTIERCNRDIAHNMGSAFMLLGAQGSQGSYALASTQRGQYEIGLENHARFVEECFNVGQDGWSVIKRIVVLNYGEDAPVPRLVARNMPTRDWSKILPLVHNLTMSKHITPDDVTEQFIRDATFMPPHDPSTAREVNMGSQDSQQEKKDSEDDSMD